MIRLTPTRTHGTHLPFRRESAGADWSCRWFAKTLLYSDGLLQPNGLRYHNASRPGLLSFEIFGKPMALKRPGFALSCFRILGHSFMNRDGTNVDFLPRIRKWADAYLRRRTLRGGFSATIVVAACKTRHRATIVFQGDWGGRLSKRFSKRSNHFPRRVASKMCPPHVVKSQSLG